MKKSLRKSLRVIVIGSIFLLCGASAFGIVSLKNETVSSGFWNVRQLVVTTHADDDDDDRREYRSSRSSGNREREHEDDNDNDNDNDRRRSSSANGSTNVPATTNTPAGSVTNTTPVNPPTNGNAAASPTQTCTTVYDTVTNASGTATKVARQSCTAAANPTPVAAPVTTSAPTTQTPAPIPVSPITPTAPQTPITSPFRDGTYLGTGKYSFPGGSIDYSVSLTIASGKISVASFTTFTTSGNGKYTRAQGDATLQKLIWASNTTVDTVTGATGTSRAIQDAVDAALAQARTASSTLATAPIPTTVVQNALTTNTQALTNPATDTTVTINTHRNIPKSPKTSDSAPISHTAPNGKVYIIHPLSTGAYIFERPDGSVSSQKFENPQSVQNYIDQHNHQYQSLGIHTAPNGNTYVVLHDLTAETYVFQRADGSMSSGYFAAKNTVIDYLNKNNPSAPKASVAVRRVPVSRTKAPSKTVAVPTARTAVAKPANTRTATTTPAKNTQTVTTNTGTAQARATAQAQAQTQAVQAQASVKPVVQTPAPAPKVNTTTKAS